MEVEGLFLRGMQEKISGVIAMKSVCGLVRKVLAVVLASWIILGSSGCQKDVVKEDLEPVFFPSPPNKPRLQFLTSYEDGSQFDIEKASFLETFVLGESEVRAETILKPHGVAIHDGKIYLCDMGQRNIKVMDIANNRFTTFPSGRSISDTKNIFIEEDGTKYVADSAMGAVSVWNAEDKLVAYLGKSLDISPADVVVRDERLYITDSKNNQVVVLNKKTGELLQKMGKRAEFPSEIGPDEFYLITDLTLDDKGNIYVGDLAKNRVTVFSPEGEFLRSYGRRGTTADCLVRVKGIAVDREARVWVVDAWPSQAVKVFRNDGRLLMYFGTAGTERGLMYLPADVVIDYDHVALFKDYAVEGAELEFIVLVTNQYGPHKVSVYGFGTFPDKYSLVPDSKKADKPGPDKAEEPGKVEAEGGDEQETPSPEKKEDG